MAGNMTINFVNNTPYTIMPQHVIQNGTKWDPEWTTIGASE
jgi:hypothetical protein